MDGGPYRSQQPADRRVLSRPELARRQAEEQPRPVEAEPKTVHRAAPSRHAASEQKSFKRFLLPILIAVIVILLAVVGWFMWSKSQGGTTAIDSNKYQAVFFTNGQVYFGKLKPFNSEYLQLTDIYYLQTQANGETDSENPQETSTNQNDVQLIKLGDEIHGPEDQMIISKDQVLFYENLKTDSKVAESIAKFKGNN